ncbi:MAG: RpiB/LacA/LacB family sugar-phosphate isomerase, partial [Gemmatimonadota bacterium]
MRSSGEQKPCWRRFDMRIAVGTDHAGWPYKGVLISDLYAAGHDVLDLGTDGPEPVDYPDFARAVA